MSGHQLADAARAGARPWIVWIRDDLRVHRHSAFAAAAERGPVLPVFVIEDSPRSRALGSAARWWQKRSLEAFARDLAALDGQLCLRRGTPEQVLAELVAEVDAAGICCLRAWDAGGREDECAVQRALPAGVRLDSLSGNLLVDPEAMLTKSGGPYRVFTPFWRALRERVDTQARPGVAPAEIRWWRHIEHSESLESIEIPGARFGWMDKLERHWNPGEQAALESLAVFADCTIATYEEDRNIPSVVGTSRLSPHLRFGEVSIRQAWETIAALRDDSNVAPNQCEAWLRELGWREFCRHLLFHFPHMQAQNFRAEFDAFAWQENPAAERAWRSGSTGYPLVDAGMRELWNTGWMHNRVRMVVASFLTKHLRIHWRHGEAWFWDTLVDADYANNPANWQWAAGTGADAAPYFRIFNPSIQARKFDPQGAYIRRWLPEIAALPDKSVQQPWLANESELSAAGVVLGETYPAPIVDHGQARAAALQAHAQLRAAAQ